VAAPGDFWHGGCMTEGTTQDGEEPKNAGRLKNGKFKKDMDQPSKEIQL
jgi:hypothetical protein